MHRPSQYVLNCPRAFHTVNSFSACRGSYAVVPVLMLSLRESGLRQGKGQHLTQCGQKASALPGFKPRPKSCGAAVLSRTAMCHGEFSSSYSFKK